MLIRSTFFLDASLLQPKLEVATAVVGGGVVIPQIYDGFDKAMKHRPFMVRSEGPWEHALNLPGRPRVGGVSGLLESFTVDDDALKRVSESLAARPGDGPRDFFVRALGRRISGGAEADFQSDLALACENRVDAFCRLAGITKDDFLQNTSFTYWQRLGGMNATVVADDVFPSRYHVMINAVAAGKGYCLIDAPERKVLREVSHRLPTWREIFDQYPLAEWYEIIRRLPFFDPNHCPIIECQLVDGAIVFLQYHIGRDFVGRKFKLTRDAKEGEVETFVYRGATGPEGVDVETAVYLPEDFETFNPLETASFGLDSGPIRSVYVEMAWPFMQASFDSSSQVQNPQAMKGVRFHLLSLVIGHMSRSKVFKPGVALLGDFLSHVPREDLKQVSGAASDEGQILPLRFHVTADGERAFVRYQGVGETP